MAQMEVSKQRPKQDLGSFQEQAAWVLTRLRTALAQLIAAIPGGVRKAADVERALDLGGTVIWPIYRFANAHDPLAVASYLPGAALMRRFLGKAAARGIPVALIDSVDQAYEAFEDLVRTHADNRRTFDTMVSAYAQGETNQLDLQHKRACFRGNSHLWGVQAKTQLSCFIYHPDVAKPDQVDLAGIRGLLGLRRFRPDASWTISHIRLSDDDGVVRRAVCREALDPEGKGPFGVPLMRDFCSTPLPKFRSVPAESGFINVELEGNSVGNLSSVTCLIGDVSRNAHARYQDEHNRYQRAQTMIRTPCEVLIQDVLVREGMFGQISPVVFVYGDHRQVDPALPGRECDLLPLRESAVYMGKGPSVLQTLDVPRYPEMAQYAFDRLGWDGDKFDVYRCRVEYPVMPSSVVVRFDLPEKP